MGDGRFVNRPYGTEMGWITAGLRPSQRRRAGACPRRPLSALAANFVQASFSGFAPKIPMVWFFDRLSRRSSDRRLFYALPLENLGEEVIVLLQLGQ